MRKIETGGLTPLEDWHVGNEPNKRAETVTCNDECRRERGTQDKDELKRLSSKKDVPSLVNIPGKSVKVKF